MKICWITSLPPKHSGIAIYSNSIIQELSELDAIDVIRWDYDSWFAKFTSPLTNMFKLRRALLEYDIVHVQYVLGEYMFLFLPLLCLLSVQKRAKVVMTLHEDYKNLRFSSFVMSFHNIFLRCADLLMVHTSEHKKLLPKSVQNKTIVIIFGTKPQYNKRTATKKDTILMQGFINPWKGHDLAIRAMTKVKQRIPSAKLIISGKPYDKKFTDRIEKLIAELNLQQNVKLIKGFIPDDKFMKLIEESEICILPYRRITMSAILSDVVGYAKPCVMSDLPAFKEYTKSKGMYFKSGDSKSLAEKIIFLLKNKTAQENMRQNFQKLSQEYSWKNVAKITYKQYKSLR